MAKMTLDLRADYLDSRGYGVSKSEGQTIHVQDLLPGESALVSIDHKGNHGNMWASVLDRTSDASGDRVTPACSGYGRCGGCPWQHLNYRGQLQEKRRHICETFGRDIDLSAAPAVVGYRNSAKFVIYEDGPKVRLGSRDQTGELVEFSGCAVLMPSLARAAEQLSECLGQIDVPPGLRYAVLRAGESGDTILLLVAHKSSPLLQLKELARYIHQSCDIGGVAIHQHDRTDGAIIAHEQPIVASIGASTVAISTLGGVDIALPHKAFWQVNHKQARVLQAIVDQCIGPNPKSVADLYGGVGPYALNAAARGIPSVLVERSIEAVEAAQRAAQAINNTCFEASDTTVESKLPSSQVIVVNPPRKGLSDSVRSALPHSDADKIIYVSCNPSTLKRDIGDLEEVFALQDICAVDLMPGTPHIELVALLSR